MGCGGSGVIVLPFLSAPNHDIGASCKQRILEERVDLRAPLFSSKSAPFHRRIVMHKGNASMAFFLGAMVIIERYEFMQTFFCIIRQESCTYVSDNWPMFGIIAGMKVLHGHWSLAVGGQP